MSSWSPTGRSVDDGRRGLRPRRLLLARLSVAAALAALASAVDRGGAGVRRRSVVRCRRLASRRLRLAGTLLSLLVSLFVGLEGKALRIAALAPARLARVGRGRGRQRWTMPRRAMPRETVDAGRLTPHRPRIVRRCGQFAARRRPARARRSACCSIPEPLSMRVAIIDYGSGNLRSATKAFERAAREAGIAAEIELTADAERVRTADRIVLPGVGAYADCRAGLDAVAGMVEAVEEVAVAKARPFLGICVGMQLMSERGLEKTDDRRASAGSPATSRRSTPADPALKIPQIGWNTIELKREHPLFAGIRDRRRTGCTPISSIPTISTPTQPEDVLAVADYGGPVTAAVARDNIAGTQFHPEKSQALGLALIANFLRWKP